MPNKELFSPFLFIFSLPFLLCSSPNFPTPSLLSLSIYLLSVSHSFSSSLCEFETNLDKHITTNQNQSVSFWKLWANLPSGFSGAAAQTRPDGYVTEAWHRSAIDISQVFFYCVFCRVFCFHAVVSGHTSGSWCEKTSRPGWWLTSRWFIFGCTDVMKPQQ